MSALPRCSDFEWRRRPLRVLEVIAGDAVVLWTRREPPPADIESARALRTGAAVTARLHDVRAPAPRGAQAQLGHAALDLARRLLPRGARVWLQQCDPAASATAAAEGATRLECRGLSVERVLEGPRRRHTGGGPDGGGGGGGGDATIIVVLDAALLRAGLAYYHAGARLGAGADRDTLMALEARARAARLNVWAAGPRGGERPWDAERRARAHGRRSPSPLRHAHAHAYAHTHAGSGAPYRAVFVDAASYGAAPAQS